MITFTHTQFTWFLLFFSALWVVFAAGACWVTRAIVLDEAEEKALAGKERQAGGRHRIVPDDSGRPLGKPDTIPLALLHLDFATGQASLKQQPPLRELVRAGRTTDQIEAWKASTDRFIAAMGGRQ